jgi:RNA polymerase sigma factor (sigma-70 family)
MATRSKSEFDSVYREHVADVRRFVFQFVQDAAVAEELAQDAFVRALNAWDGYRGDSPVRIWLLRIARNVCLDYVRSPRARADAAVPLDVDADSIDASTGFSGAASPPLSVEQRAVQSEMTECVQQFVLSLPETLRTPLILHDMHGLTNEQIAHVLDCSLEAAKMRLHRSRVKLREMMEQRCDLFHDERNVLSCLPAPPEPALIPAAAIADPEPPRTR